MRRPIGDDKLKIFFNQGSYRNSNIISLYILYVIIATTSFHQSQYNSDIVNGTTILAYDKDNTVWVATDSRTVISDYWGKRVAVRDTTCKVFTGKNIIVAKSGFRGDESGLFCINNAIRYIFPT